MTEAAAPYGIYLASKAVHGARWREMRASGLPIVSSWIDESEVGATGDWGDLWDRCIREASRSRAILLYVEDDENLKGALVEAGAGLACGVPVHVVCPPSFTHTFLRHPLVRRHAGIGEALLMIAKENARPSRLPGIRGLVRDVRTFCEACGNEVSEFPTVLPEERQKHRNSMLSEEWHEAHRGLKAGDVVAMADGIADMIYVAIGTALERGVEIVPSPLLQDVVTPGMAGLVERQRGLLGGEGLPAVPCIPEGRRFAWDWGHLLRRVNESLTDRAAWDGKYLADKLSDVVDQAIIVGVSCGIPLDEVWAEVHRSNMEKIDPLTGRVQRSPTGKLLKPAGWVGPDIKGILMRHGWVPGEG